jgi:hypothetical protein
MVGFYNEPSLRALICGYSPSIVVAEDTGMAEDYMIGDINTPATHFLRRYREGNASVSH